MSVKLIYKHICDRCLAECGSEDYTLPMGGFAVPPPLPSPGNRMLGSLTLCPSCMPIVNAALKKAMELT